jgi:hypothetical protein
MNHEIAKLWAAELRSGKYQRLKQEMGVHAGSDGVVIRLSGRCCLGVLREVLLERDWTARGDMYDPKTLTREEAARAGMRAVGGEVGRFSDGSSPDFNMLGLSCLTSVNDSTGATFEDIADFIDEHWERL